MKNQSKNNFLNLFTGISILGVLLFAFCVYVLKDSYAIQVDDNGVPTTTFTSNYSGSSNDLVNYIADSLTPSYENRKYFENFKVPNNYRTSDGTTPLYILTKNANIARTTESFEITSGNPSGVSDIGIKYILAHGYNNLNTNDIFSTGEYGTVNDNNIKHYITQIALWLYMLENKNSFTSTYCPTVNVHLSDSDTTPDAFKSMNGCDFYHSAKSDTYITETASVEEVKKIITDAASKSNYNYLNYILKLEGDAMNNRTVGESSVGISITNKNSINYSISSDGKSLTTEAISPTVTNPSYPYLYYSVEVIDPNKYGAYITNINGKKISNTNNMSGSFKIYVPIIDDMSLSTIEIKVTATFVKLDGNSYRVTKSTSQDKTFDENNKKQTFSDVLLGYIPTQTASASLKLKNLTKISKVDATNSEELPGAELVVKYKDTNDIIAKWTSGTTPKFLFLEDGNYTLCETTAPTNYELNTECIDFIVDGSKLTSVTMKNEPINKVSVPDTSTFVNILFYIGGALVIIVGITFAALNYKKKN